MNGIYLYFGNKHRSRWPLLGLEFALCSAEANHGFATDTSYEVIMRVN